MKHKALTTDLVAVGEASLLKAQKRVIACQGCSGAVTRSFSSVLVEVFGAEGPVCEYLLCGPARCPNCARAIYENTLVRCEGEFEPDEMMVVKEFIPSWDDTNVVLIDQAMLDRAQASISGCEACAPSAEITFDYILDAVTECDPTVTEYVMCRPAKCPCCFHEITEKTLVLAD
jgi:hypothetical protein